ncbi:nitroreductase family protein [Actinacidiphila rubida]|uniref:nitroreductase family protein n=1 Tax=Actinacidiphila rubida TaxID=310780 RepID=UPI000944980A|nr:nitroreductase family protein [Actinacidiphila rubida]
MGYAQEYATAIVRRGRYPMEPADWVPDWADRPRKGKYFPDAPLFPLPSGPTPTAGATGATVERGLHGPRGTGAFTLPLLAGMLQDSYGLTGRRLAVQANSDLGTLPMYTQANWSRGSASGGGLYPVGVHWIAGPGGPLTPGVHYYDTQQHAVRRLLTGDVTPQVRAAVGEPAAGHRQFLVLGVRFWQNAFKYNSFSYHVVTMDTGALLETWRIWARAHGLHIGPALWFDEPALGGLLGLDADEEGVFAVVPLRWAGDPDPLPQGTEAGPDTTAPGGSPAGAVDGPPSGPVRVAHADRERSRSVTAFETVKAMHDATLAGAASRPAPGALDPALALPVEPGGERTALPAPDALDLGVRTALRSRRSSFGRFQAVTPMPARHLSTVLAAAHAAGRLDSDTEPAGDRPLTRLYVFVNHVAGIDQGSYVYDAADGSLRLLRAGAPGEFLQRNYFLANYNLEQAAAVMVPAARTRSVLDAVGDRGYRLVNAVVGGVSQAVYTAAAAAGLSCGVALGFDAISYTEELGLDATGEIPLLTMMIGHERPRPADFRSEIA